MHKYLLLSLVCICCARTHAQISRLGNNLEFNITANGQFGSGDNTPFWQSANKYGLSSVENNSGYLRASIKRDATADEGRKWRMGYGADLVAPINYSSKFIVQQLYADIDYRVLRLTVGQKERAAELKNADLSSGSMALGTNARPIPQIRLETHDFFAIPGTKKWINLKGHAAYGWYADNRWQRNFNAGNTEAVYTTNSRYHSKAGYMRVGNLDKFPLVFTGGAEMVCQFGGTIWNRGITGQQSDGSYKAGSGIKEYFEAFIPSGGDATDGENANVTGNGIGSYQARLDYHGNGWTASAYGEHFFEDHSMMGFDFTWKDFLFGGEIQLPKNRFVSTLLYEHMRSTDQSGPIFKDENTHGIAENVGGMDDYYNHYNYGAYQHAGFVLGTPLFLSPLYNGNNDINVYDNRIVANHIGISGQPCSEIGYRVLYTHEKSWGTYKNPRTNPTTGQFWLVEATYRPQRIQGLTVIASYGQNHGELLGDSKGGMLTISYNGFFK